MVVVDDLLACLAVGRPVFHSEADFQHAFAWLLHHTHPEFELRLEIPLHAPEGVVHLDLLATSRDQSIAVETKYKTRSLACIAANEEFRLANHAAQDLARYDFIKDIRRLERLASAHMCTSAYAILLTNDSSYWTPGRPNAVDAAFRLQEGRALQGTLEWDPRASAGTTRGREPALSLSGSYTVAWRDYSRVDSPRHEAFRYLAVQVLGREG
jgi:hypothetical protein